MLDAGGTVDEYNELLNRIVGASPADPPTPAARETPKTFVLAIFGPCNLRQTGEGLWVTWTCQVSQRARPFSGWLGLVVSVARSVLRVSDQVAGVFPDRCVLSGVETARAVRLTATQFGGPRWLLGIPGFAVLVGLVPGHDRCAVALPISDRIWKIWRLRNVVALAALAAGVTFVVIGGATGTVGLAVFGLVIVVGTVAYRARANHNYWVTCIMHPANATILVEPTHRQFDEAARDLFIRTLS